MVVKQLPITRFYCHCKICQAVYGKDFGDPTMVWERNVKIEDDSKIKFQKQRSFPISVTCGICRSCEQPVVGYSRFLPFFTIAYLPSYTYQDQTVVPKSVGHIFYESCVQNIDDELPKYKGLVSSQFAVARFILNGIFGLSYI